MSTIITGGFGAESPDNIIDENRAKEILLVDRKLLRVSKEKEDNMDIRLYKILRIQLIVDAKKAQLIDSREGLLEQGGCRSIRILTKAMRDYIKDYKVYIPI